MMKIYTKSGDKGKTSLYDNTRVAKDSLRVESYGTIDELNSALGFAKNFIEEEELYKIIRSVQRQLFNLAGELATTDWESFPEKISFTCLPNIFMILTPVFKGSTVLMCIPKSSVEGFG